MTLRGTAVAAAILLVGSLVSSGALAWGPHTEITRAALDAVHATDAAEDWREAFGEENLDALTRFCWLPDQQGHDLGSFYADDYLLFPALPYHVNHVMPHVVESFAPCFHRSLQALRTETSVNASRHLGTLLHFVEDAGAPPHAKERCPHHYELENWLPADQIAIPGYRPRLLGATDEKALAGFEDRMAALIAYSAERAEQALPLVEAEDGRAQVEPIILEAALESARVSADVLYTMFTLGLATQPPGAGLAGTVTAAEIPLRNDHGARIVLLGTDYTTLAVTAEGESAGSGWQGSYAFRNLPAGTYRVLAYRTASQVQVSDPVTLRTGEVTRLDFSLRPTEPAGNLVQNPDGSLEYLLSGTEGRPAVKEDMHPPGAAHVRGPHALAAGRSMLPPSEQMVDRWRYRSDDPGPRWTSDMIHVHPGVTYRCGAVVHDESVRVRFQFHAASLPRDTDAARRELATGTHPAELRHTATENHQAAFVIVETDRPLAEAIERVWVVPE